VDIMRIGTIVVASGCFYCLHIGHLDYLHLAYLLGDHLIVLVDSDEKVKVKKGFVFMPENQRVDIIRSIRYVDYAYVINTSVAEELEHIRPDIFAKGGDRTIDTIPIEEISVCHKYDIKLITGLGNKIESSSRLINRIKGK
jgi:D-beta-D-heptose 7-phosphate kinase/D-beta-D-heptose 1-phosphate adenosyltransferase